MAPRNARVRTPSPLSSPYRLQRKDHDLHVDIGSTPPGDPDEALTSSMEKLRLTSGERTQRAIAAAREATEVRPPSSRERSPEKLHPLYPENVSPPGTPEGHVADVPPAFGATPPSASLMFPDDPDDDVPGTDGSRSDTSRGRLNVGTFRRGLRSLLRWRMIVICTLNFLLLVAIVKTNGDNNIQKRLIKLAGLPNRFIAEIQKKLPPKSTTSRQAMNSL